MPRKKYSFLPGREDANVNCFAYGRTKSGEPACSALTDIFCLKEYAPCAFFATPAQASAARRRSAFYRAKRGL
ncbi:MAG: hypothetical protein LBT12_08675 [Oscillospiraceae bacterium]|jgi:hypothetical protein|nr:hypothetical protein [Oscillospiraceae bacterium]